MNTKLIKMLVLLSLIVVIAGGLTRLVRGNSMSLTEYERLNASAGSQNVSDDDSDGSLGGSADGSDGSQNASADGSDGSLGASADGSDGSLDASADNSHGSQSSSAGTSPSGSQNASTGYDSHSDRDSLTPSGSSDSSDPSAPSGSLNGSDSSQDGTSLTGAVLNGSSQASQRVSLTEDFYYEPLSDNLRRYITGVSYPAVQSEDEAAALAVDYDDLRYVHVLHYDFEGNPTEGELICNEYIAQDLVEIFHELYYSEYQIERMVLIDEYDGDDTASMEDNNTSCFNYRVVEGSESLSKHAYGLAIDINPFYNPYVTYDKDGSERVSPVAAQGYADRSVSFPYKIDEEDLCCRLFKEHGFIWGGNWNSLKDYQHFQKTPK